MNLGFLLISRESWITVILSLILSLPVGVISGLYSGLIVARYQRFSDLRTRVLRIIREIDFIQEGSKFVFPRRKEVSELFFIASDFFFLSHERAGEETLRLEAEITETLRKASRGGIDFEAFNSIYLSWQERGRHLGPSLVWILRLWGGL
jgi:hypothetical protein